MKGSFDRRAAAWVVRRSVAGCAGDRLSGERLWLSCAGDVAVFGLEHRSQLIAKLRGVLVAVGGGGVLGGGVEDFVLLADDRQ